MAEFRKSAVKIMQGKRALFLTFLTVRDFMTEGFYRVDHLDTQKSTGMQRLLDDARARSFGNDIIGADEHNEAFLPTSVFLATNGNIGYDEGDKEMFFDVAGHGGVCPLDVVDGQHRIEGLRYAVKKDENLLDFPVSVVIAPNMSEAEKMLQFVVVNTKQRPVDAGVAQNITARFTDMLELEDLPYLPLWLKKAAAKGDDSQALGIAKKFNSEEGHPWKGRIQFADETKGSGNARYTIKQMSFVKLVKRVILAKNHPLHNFTAEKRFGILRNYWIAVERICVASADASGADAGANTVVFKYTGLNFFHQILAPVINQLAKNKLYTVDAIESCIRSAQEHLSPEYAGVFSPEFWRSGGKASGLNAGALDKLAADFSSALATAHSNEIQL